MFSYLRSLKFREACIVEAPALALSIVIAELFYKFHSFTLECLAFLATWVVISAMSQALSKRFLPTTSSVG